MIRFPNLLRSAEPVALQLKKKSPVTNKFPESMYRTSIPLKSAPATVLLLLFALLLSAGEARAQQQSAFQSDFRSVGIYVGTYTPSFDYFDRTFWNFSTGVKFGMEGDYDITPHSGVRMSIGLSTLSSEVSRVPGTTERLRYQFIPFTIAPYLYYEPDYVTLFLRAGVDFTAVLSRYSVDTPSRLGNGSTTTFHIETAVERALEDFGIALNLRYTFGSFDQDFTFNEGGTVNTEKINLNGFSISLSVKRFL